MKQLSATVKHEVVLRDDGQSSRALETTPYTRSTRKEKRGGAGDHQTTRSTCKPLLDERAVT